MKISLLQYVLKPYPVCCILHHQRYVHRQCIYAHSGKTMQILPTKISLCVVDLTLCTLLSVCGAGELSLNELLEKYNLHQQSLTPECDEGEVSEEHEG